MAKPYRDILGMQLDMLVKTKRYNEQHTSAPTRLASGKECTDPRTGVKYKIVG